MTATMTTATALQVATGNLMGLQSAMFKARGQAREQLAKVLTTPFGQDLPLHLLDKVLRTQEAARPWAHVEERHGNRGGSAFVEAVVEVRERIRCALETEAERGSDAIVTERERHEHNGQLRFMKETRVVLDALDPALASK